MNFVESLNLFGVPAKEIPCIRGSGAPSATTAGAVGSLYMNTENGDVYKCTAAADGVYTWVAFEGSGSGSGGNVAQGLTAEQIAALDGMFKVCAYDDSKDISGAYEAFKDAFGLNIRATGIALSKTTLSFTETASQMITATVEPENSTDTVVWTTSAPGVATVVNGVVTPVANGNCTITATAGKVSASCSVSVAFEVEVVYYTVTNSLTNCASNNNTASIVEGGAYTATLTADEGYTLDGASISVVVNGEDVTDTAYSDGVITIHNVLGNVVITATAVEESTDSGEVVMLKNISFDGTSYLDTEFIPSNINQKYVFGIQTVATTDSTNQYFAGVSMRDTTSLANSAYLDYTWSYRGAENNYNADRPRTDIVTNIFGAADVVLKTGNDKGDGESSQPYAQPFYMAITDGEQALWLDEDLTVAPTLGHFPGATGTTKFSESTYYDPAKFPIMSMWLGRIRITGIGASLYKTFAAGMKFYCFKVYDENSELIVNMRPAKLGSTIGMWDTVRNKFYPATGTANYEEVSA